MSENTNIDDLARLLNTTVQETGAFTQRRSAAAMLLTFWQHVGGQTARDLSMSNQRFGIGIARRNVETYQCSSYVTY